MRLRVDRVVLQAVACLVAAHFNRAQIVRTTASVHHRLGAQIRVRAGNVTGAAPFRARNYAAEQRKRTLHRRRRRWRRCHGGRGCSGRSAGKRGGGRRTGGVRCGSRFRWFGQLTHVVLAIDDLALIHELDHFFELDLKRPIDVAEFVQHALAAFVVAGKEHFVLRLCYKFHKFIHFISYTQSIINQNALTICMYV